MARLSNWNHSEAPSNEKRQVHHHEETSVGCGKVGNWLKIPSAVISVYRLAEKKLILTEIHGCWRASSTVIRFLGSTVSNFFTRSIATKRKHQRTLVRVNHWSFSPHQVVFGMLRCLFCPKTSPQLVKHIFHRGQYKTISNLQKQRTLTGHVWNLWETL